MGWLLYGLKVFIDVIFDAIVGLFALIGWAGRSFANLTAQGKVGVLIATAALVVLASVVDVPFLEGSSSATTEQQEEEESESFFDMTDEEQEQALRNEWPLYAAHACEALETLPGKQGVYAAFDEFQDRPLTYREALEVSDIAEETYCPGLAGADGRLDQLRRYMKRYKNLFDGAPNE